MSEDPPSDGTGDGFPGFRVHPVDLLVLVLALGLAALAYAYLFRTSPIPRPVDPLLGVELEAEFTADRPWKGDFLTVGAEVLVDEYLLADVLERVVEEKKDGVVVRVLLRIRERETQKPEAMTLFRTGIRRGSWIQLSDPTSLVSAEVTRVGTAPGSK